MDSPLTVLFLLALGAARYIARRTEVRARAAETQPLERLIDDEQRRQAAEECAPLWDMLDVPVDEETRG